MLAKDASELAESVRAARESLVSRGRSLPIRLECLTEQSLCRQLESRP
jgi:hypothetical protein